MSSIAVLIPCFDEEATVAKVVSDFRSALPGATVYVYDNRSNDRTVEVARAAGAIVRSEEQRGKGHVVRRMFSDIDADIYVLVDGDDTYDASAAPKLVETLIDGQLDMVTGMRTTNVQKAYRPGHRFGNRLLTGLVATVFGRRTTDMLSGYRVLSRRFVKSFPALSRGFETETELTVHALELSMPVAEVETVYSERPEGSESKLNTIADGVRILRMILTLIREERPLPFFTILAAILVLVSVGLAVPIVVEFAATGLVPRFPTAILSTAIMIIAALLFFAGLILDTVTHGRREMKRLAYLSHPAPRRTDASLAVVSEAKTGSRKG